MENDKYSVYENKNDTANHVPPNEKRTQGFVMPERHDTPTDRAEDNQNQSVYYDDLYLSNGDTPIPIIPDYNGNLNKDILYPGMGGYIMNGASYPVNFDTATSVSNFAPVEAVSRVKNIDTQSQENQSTQNQNNQSTQSQQHNSTQSNSNDFTKSQQNQSTQNISYNSMKSQENQSTQNQNNQSTQSRSYDFMNNQENQTTQSISNDSMKSQENQSTQNISNESMKSQENQSTQNISNDSMKSQENTHTINQESSSISGSQDSFRHSQNQFHSSGDEAQLNYGNKDANELNKDPKNSQNQRLYARSGSRGMWVFWTIFGIAVVGVFLMLFLIGCSNQNLSLSLQANDSVRAYENSTVKLVTEGKIKDDDIIIWQIDGKEVKKVQSNVEGAYELKLNQTQPKNIVVSASIEGKSQTVSKTITIRKPLLVIKINNQELTYGEELPEFSYTVSGLVGNDSIETLNIEPQLMSEYATTKNAGEYKIKMETPLTLEKYDVQVEEGNLVVNKKNLTFSGTITKVYDGTNKIENNYQKTALNGVAEGDEVMLNNDSIEFESKNAGKQKIVIKNYTLTGKNAGNYTLNQLENDVYGQIVQKTITINNLMANDKLYDGTDSVTFSSVGSLTGIVSGDSVAIGEIQAKFNDAYPGRNKSVILQSIKLVGEDAVNYTPQIIENIRANIYHKKH